MGLAFIPLYVRYLGIEAYGLIGMFAVLQAWFALLDMGMTPALSREMARFTGGTHSAQSIRDLLRSIEICVFGLAGGIVAGIWVASDWLSSEWLQAENLSAEAVAQAFAIMAIVIALRFVEGIYRSSIIGLQRQILFNVVSSIMATIRGFGAVGILAWISPTINAFFIWQAVVSGLSVAVLATATYHALPRGYRRGRFSLSSLLGIARYSFGLMSITFLALLLTQVDKIILSKLLTLKEYGYYTIAGVVAGALSMLVGPICQAALPRLSELRARNEQESFVRIYHSGAQLVTVVMGSAAVVLFAFAETILRLWTQDAELAGRTAPLLRILTLGNMLHGLMWIPYQTQLAYGWTGLTVRINIIAVLIIIPLFLLVVPRFGAEGAAWVWVALNAGYVLISIHLIHRSILIGEKSRWYIQDVTLPLVSAIIIAGICWQLAPINRSNILDFTVIIISSGCVMFASILGAPRIRSQVTRHISKYFETRYL